MRPMLDLSLFDKLHAIEKINTVTKYVPDI